MKTKNILIVCDVGNQCYWNIWINKIKEKIRSANIEMDKDTSRWKNNNAYAMIMVDVSNIEDLRRLVPEIRYKQPQCRILVISSTPTWKQAREIIRLGAANLIRKSSNLEEIIKEIESL